MRPITVSTRALVGLLSDLALTAGTDPETPTLCTLALWTTRGEWVMDLPDDGGADHEVPLFDALDSLLLVGTSTDGYAAAQASAPCDCDGEGLSRPVLVAVADVGALVKVFRPLIHSLGKEVTHRSVLALSGTLLTVGEDPRQVPSGIEVSVPALEADDFPAVWSIMAPDPTELVPDRDGVVEPASYGTAYTGRYLETFGKVSKRRGMALVMYRHHQHRRVVVEVGASYRAVVRPVGLRDETALSAPTVRVFAPEPLGAVQA